MILNFVMMVTGHLAESYYGRAESCQEFRDIYEEGGYEKEDNSEVEMEELFVRDFDCPLCKVRHQWLRVDGPNKECYIECKSCKATFAVGMNDCANCVDREVKCIAIIP
jgi:hypothetical protein